MRVNCGPEPIRKAQRREVHAETIAGGAAVKVYRNPSEAYPYSSVGVRGDRAAVLGRETPLGSAATVTVRASRSARVTIEC